MKSSLMSTAHALSAELLYFNTERILMVIIIVMWLYFDVIFTDKNHINRAEVGTMVKVGSNWTFNNPENVSFIFPCE